VFKKVHGKGMSFRGNNDIGRSPMAIGQRPAKSVDIADNTGLDSPDRSFQFLILFKQFDGQNSRRQVDFFGCAWNQETGEL
jgi:hypothetical protein